VRRRAAGCAAAALLLAGCTARLSFSSGPVPPGPSPAPYRLTAGVVLYADRDWPLADTEARGRQSIAWAARVLHVSAVQIAWTYEVRGDRASTVDAAGPGTPPPADIGALTSIARSYGLQVTYRVLLRVPGRVEPLRPARPAGFLGSLLAAERPYLALAQQDHVAEFIAGTERASIASSPRWAWFFAKAAGIYRGILSYAQWGGEPGDGGFFYGDGHLMPVSEYGVTAYPNIALPATATVTDLTAAWEAFLSRVPAPVLHRTAIDEIGIPAAAGAYGRPWDWPGSGPPDDEVQARWFTAACTAAAAEHMRGIWFWNINLADDPAAPSPSPVKFENRPAAEAAIRSCTEGGR